MLCELIGEPIKQSTKLIGELVKGRVKRALRKALALVRVRRRAHLWRRVLWTLHATLAQHLSGINGRAAAGTTSGRHAAAQAVPLFMQLQAVVRLRNPETLVV